jgi:hypothetical protein
MTADAGSPEPKEPRPDFELPELVDVRIRRVTYEPPKLRNFRSALADERQAVEFVVTTDRPIPIRALGPALYVGGTALTETKPLRKRNTYRFFAFDTDALEPGAPISLGWSGQPSGERRESRFTYTENRRRG